MTPLLVRLIGNDVERDTGKEGTDDIEELDQAETGSTTGSRSHLRNVYIDTALSKTDGVTLFGCCWHILVCGYVSRSV